MIDKKGILKKNKKKKDLEFEEIKSFFIKYIFPVVALFIVGVLMFTIFLPDIQEIMDLYYKMAQLDENSTVLDGNIEELKRVSTLPISNMRAKIDKVIPKYVNVSAIVGEIESIGESSGLTIKIPDKEKQIGGVEKLMGHEEYSGEISEANVAALVPIRVEITGSKEGVKRFLASLKRGRYLFSLASADVNVREGDIYSIEISLSVYVSPAPKSFYDEETKTVDPNSPEIYEPINPITINVTEERFNQIMSNFNLQ
uniref:Uncharacterized protein n=1 Tax=candidate division CPR3 bacterium TaxID=2268181 RepID=A0A7C5URU4_UNCC3